MVLTFRILTMGVMPLLARKLQVLSSQFALLRAARQQLGHPVPRFVRALVVTRQWS